MQQTTRNESGATSTASLQFLPSNDRRIAFLITNTGGGTTVTIAKGVAAAIAGKGIQLSVNNSYYESDSEGFRCWRGPIQIIADGVGTYSLAETTEY